MPNKFGKSTDKTYLSLDNAEERGFIHRDYIAHCLRWTHIVKFLQEKQRYKTAYVMDIGCGQEAPLLKTLYTSRLLPYVYCGVDVGPIKIFNTMPALRKFAFSEDHMEGILLIPECNILELEPPPTYQHAPDVIVMFEVLEHNEKETGVKILETLKKFGGPQTTLFISTPCYDGKNLAANHVYEWSYNELAAELTKHFIIENVWGTFASIRDYDHRLDQISIDGLSEIFRRMREYYDVNYLATIFAPLFPELSRNCLWQLHYKHQLA
jgi:hypothetical protein